MIELVMEKTMTKTIAAFTETDEGQNDFYLIMAGVVGGI